MLARRVLARTAARPAMASALRGASLRATAAAKASTSRAAAAVAGAGRAPTVAAARPALLGVARAWMGELAYKHDQRIPEVVGQVPSRNARLPITELPHGPEHIGKDHMPPPVFDQPFRPYKSRQISDKYKLGIIENPMTDPYLVDKTLVTDQENADFKRYRYPAWAWAAVRGAWRYVLQTVRGRKLWEPITDQHFCTIFSRNWPYRSLLTRHKAGDTKDEKEYVLDVTVMSKLIPYQPYFTEGCKVFFRRPIVPADHDGPARGQSDLEGYRVMRIDRIEMVSGNGGVSDVKRPDGSTPEQEWDLVKMFAMQGAHYMIKFGQHAIFHFPHDAFLRITKEYFGPNTVIRQLLTPHMEFVHTINFVVLFGKMSVLNAGGRGTPFIFDIQTCDREQVQGMLRVANSQKPVFTTRALNHKLQPYYEAIANYVSQVVDYWWPKATEKEKANIKTWGHALHHYMGFPVEKAAHHAKDATDRYENPNALYFKDQPKDMGLLTELDTDPKALKIILTDYIYRISVQHSADHWGFMQIPCNISPMVMRIPYSRNSYMSKKRPPYSRWDDIKGFMYNEVFVAWTNNQYFHDDRLMNVQYPYTDPQLQAMADAFRKSLTLAELAVPYGEIPLESICKTLEW